MDVLSCVPGINANYNFFVVLTYATRPAMSGRSFAADKSIKRGRYVEMAITFLLQAIGIVRVVRVREIRTY